LPTSATTITKINYVALGDSYSSGEGLAAQASGYITNLGYSTGKDGCHRASDAYPELVNKSFGSNAGTFTFVACSGAYSGFTVSPFGKGGSMLSGRDGEAPQIPKHPVATNYLNPSVNDISLTIGGNDAGFADVVTSCTSIMVKTGPIQKVVGLPPLLVGGSCASRLASSDKVIGNGTTNTELGAGLVKTYEVILSSATNARLAVLTYPQLMTPQQIPTSKFCPLTGGALIPDTASTAYLGLNSKVQGDINAMEANTNRDIMSAVAAVAAMPAYQGRIRAVNLTASTTPYAQPCDTKTMNRSDINGIDLAVGDGIIQAYRCYYRVNSGAACNNLIGTQTLHPTEAGHQRMATAVESAFAANWSTSTTTTTSTTMATIPTSGGGPQSIPSVVSDGTGYCEVLTSGGVDCWGYGGEGALGNGATSNSDVSVAVEGVNGVGLLSGVVSLVGESDGYCALLTSGGVDCWGGNYYGGLGNGLTSNSDVPVAVEGVNGVGLLSGVARVSSDVGYCALLTSGGVDCWGYGGEGALGNGATGTSDVPVQVEGVNGVGLLNGVVSLVGGWNSYCAVLTTGGVDCWGAIVTSSNGFNSNSNVPVAVEGVNGVGPLSGVANLVGGGESYCALLTSGGVDCWGIGFYGELGNGLTSDSNLPVEVEGVGGVGLLSGVASLSSGGSGYCALLNSGGVDCWGSNSDGELGNGLTSDSDVPVEVEGVNGVGLLSGVASLSSGGIGQCAVLTSGGVDCWGRVAFSNGIVSDSDVPVAVKGVNGVGLLSGVASLSSGVSGYCALLTSGGVDCWGSNSDGELGNGLTSDSDVPVEVA